MYKFSLFAKIQTAKKCVESFIQICQWCNIWKYFINIFLNVEMLIQFWIPQFFCFPMMIALHHFLSCPCESKRLHFQAEFLQFLVLLLQPSTRIWHIGQNAKGNLSWSSILSWLDRKSTWNQELLWRCSCHDGWFWIGNCILDHRKCCERENYWNKIKPIRFHWRQSNRIFRGKSCGTWAYSTKVSARKRSN